MSDSVTSWTAAHQAPLSFSISWNLLKFMSIESVMTSNHLILCCSFCLQSFLSPGSFQWIGCFWRKSWLIWNNLFSWCDFSESNCSLTIFRSHVNWTNCFGWVKDRDCSKMHIWHKTKILWMSVAFPKVILLSRLWKIIIILDYVLWDIGREKIIKVNSAKLNWKKLNNLGDIMHIYYWRSLLWSNWNYECFRPC